MCEIAPWGGRGRGARERVSARGSSPRGAGLAGTHRIGEVVNARDAALRERERRREELGEHRHELLHRAVLLVRQLDDLVPQAVQRDGRRLGAAAAAGDRQLALVRELHERLARGLVKEDLVLAGLLELVDQVLRHQRRTLDVILDQVVVLGEVPDICPQCVGFFGRELG